MSKKSFRSPITTYTQAEERAIRRAIEQATKYMETYGSGSKPGANILDHRAYISD